MLARDPDLVDLHDKFRGGRCDNKIDNIAKKTKVLKNNIFIPNLDENASSSALLFKLTLLLVE